MTTVTPGASLAEFVNAEAPTPVGQVLAFFDELPAVLREEMLGEWSGDLVPTGHPGEAQLDALRWAGKRFTSDDDVNPLICLDDAGERQVSDLLGAATLRTVAYRGVSTATMVYDKQPIFDHFRRVDADTVLGAMDRKGEPEPLMFVLRRVAA
ncbi:MAG: DUF4334 domain-containing protein [Solirubrobacteraceae bacterium]|nr:DUF4334 domain-containing protein [Solirubrobacteraceae bacterium]